MQERSGLASFNGLYGAGGESAGSPSRTGQENENSSSNRGLEKEMTKKIEIE